jgi:hypothetical protein
VLAILWLYCYGCPVPVFLSNGCSLSVVLSQLIYWFGFSALMFLTCPCCHVLAISCPLSPAELTCQAYLFRMSCPAILFRISCPGGRVPAVLSKLSRLAVLSSFPCPACPIPSPPAVLSLLLSSFCLVLVIFNVHDCPE